MATAWLLALLGLMGVAVGVWLGRPRKLSNLVAGAAAGLLLGIAAFWLVPEMAGDSGWMVACGLTIGAALLLGAIDHLFLHPQNGAGATALGPVLAASALHSFLDGWTVRALAQLPVAEFAAPLGLALHKVPEGIAIGWIAKRGTGSHMKAALAAAAVELLTVVGAYVEPLANRSGAAAFGVWWTTGALAIVAGSFLFFGVHALLPNRKQWSVVGIAWLTFALVGTASLMKGERL